MIKGPIDLKEFRVLIVQLVEDSYDRNEYGTNRPISDEELVEAITDLVWRVRQGLEQDKLVDSYPRPSLQVIRHRDDNSTTDTVVMPRIKDRENVGLDILEGNDPGSGYEFKGF